MADALEIPVFPRVTDYVGVWAVEPRAADLLLARARAADLAAHVRDAAPPKLSAALQTVKADSGQNVAVVMLRGTLMKSVGSMSAGTSTVAARRELRQAANDPDVAAIVLAIDSPGGTVSGTADLAAEVKAAAKKKPVYAYAEDLCASAAYWVASQCDAVFANTDTALVGSIGTLMVVYDMSGAAGQAGVKTLVFGTGPLKGAGAPGAPVTDEQQAYFRGLVESSQVAFDAAVQKARSLTDRQLSAAKTGGVFGAADAMDRKLIDGIKGFDAVVNDAAAAARARAKAPRPMKAELSPNQKGATVDENSVGAVATAPIVDAIAESRKAAAAELRRQAEIGKRCAAHPGIAAEAIEQGWTPDAAELACLKAGLPKVSAPTNPHNPGYNPAIVDRGHGRVCTVEALQAAMILRAGGRLDDPAFRSPAAFGMKVPAFLRAGLNDAARNQHMEAGHQFASLSLIDLARECVRLDGKHVPHAQDELFASAFSSGSSLTNIFTTSVNAVMLVTYTEAGDTTGGWTTTTDVADFKTNDRIRVDIGPGLDKLPRGAEANHSKYADSAESYKIARYAKQFVVDEQDMIDDSMQALDEVPRQHARAAARMRPDLAYAILLANPTMGATGRALFHATDGNLGSGAALSAANLKAGLSAMFLLQENGVNLNTRGTHLLLPPTLEWTGKELLNSTAIVIAGTAGSVTERGNANTLTTANLSLVADARLENGVTDPASGTTYSGSASTWFLASTERYTIEVAYRRGTGRVPQVRSFVLDKGKWGMGWDVNLDIGAKALDGKGLRKTTA